MKFKIGDDARLVWMNPSLLPEFGHMLGKTCTIVDLIRRDDESHAWVVEFHDGTPVPEDESNDWPHGWLGGDCCFEPIQKLGDWGTLEQATGWKPGKVRGWFPELYNCRCVIVQLPEENE